MNQYCLLIAGCSKYWGFKFGELSGLLYNKQKQVYPGRMKAKGAKRLSHDEKVLKCQQFLKNFEDYDITDVPPAYEHYGRKKYMIEMQKVANEQQKSIYILFEDLEAFFRKEDEKEMVEDFRTNTSRSLKIFTDLTGKLMPERNVEVPNDREVRKRFDSLLETHRRQNYANNMGGQGSPENEKIPLAITKKFEIYIVYGPGSKIHATTISELNSDKIGSLVACKAIVVRASEIKPELTVATYACDSCGCENYQEIYGGVYQPMTRCMSRKCIENKINGKITFLPGHSTFCEYQELKVQETTEQLHTGRIPKTFTLHMKGSNCRQASPGDVIFVQGVLLPINKSHGGRKDYGLAFNTYIEVFKVTRQKKKYVEMAMSEEQIMKVHSIRSSMTDDELFKKLARSIAPEIYGMEVVKKSLLLLMVGGVTQTTHDNLRIRGEINVALIGDPGIAKSQLLKHISSVAPRGVYTTGKGSSSVGLTAAVIMDPLSNQLHLEAGALVLADMGVCCIDEFDKMGEYDRTAIHEVMEQQTVSIAKAGIIASLNARASILAAANPLYGRYNAKETPHKNINLPAALLSRFDLIFILLDTSDANRDLDLAKHIGKVHQNERAPRMEEQFDETFIRNYVALSKEYTPLISEELHQEMINRYIEKRKQQMDVTKEGENYTTMRSLLALIRLCQARARLRFSNEVSPSDVADCLEIIQESQKTTSDGDDDSKKHSKDASSQIFGIIKAICGGSRSLAGELQVIQKRILARGYSEIDLQKTLENYQNLNVLMVHEGLVRLIS